MCYLQSSFYHSFLCIKVAICLLKAKWISFWYSQDHSTAYLKKYFWTPLLQTLSSYGYNSVPSSDVWDFPAHQAILLTSWIA